MLGSLAASAREGRGGLIVNVSSDAAVNAYASWGAYGASKAALLHLTRIWQEELGPIGVQVVSFDPGRHGYSAARRRRYPMPIATMLKAPATSARELVALDRERPGAAAAAGGRRRREGGAMIPATAPIQRPRDARLLSVDAFGRTRHMARSRLVDLLHP